jgi:hypothetical protein
MFLSDSKWRMLNRFSRNVSFWVRSCLRNKKKIFSLCTNKKIFFSLFTNKKIFSFFTNKKIFFVVYEQKIYFRCL